MSSEIVEKATTEVLGKRGITAPWIQANPERFVRQINYTNQNVWRQIVDLQPVAGLSRDHIVSKLSSLDWRIEPKDPNLREELRAKILYYTNLFTQNKKQNMDFTEFLSWILEDSFDLPIGGICELVYQNDNPRNRLTDYIPLDGATIYPTFNPDFPLVQITDTTVDNPVAFPSFAVNRLYYSPNRKLEWRGWGVPPPVKLFLAINMISKGDEYYWKMLSDTPEAGILDLMDMSKEDAEEWIESFRTLVTGIDPYKIPVLYQHTQKANYIPFTRNPNEIQFDKGIGRYTALLTSAYGITPDSIGLGGGGGSGETLAGTIRGERQERSKGIGLAKRKVQLFYNRMLPDELAFKFIDPDEEQQVARGRALLSTATAMNSFVRAKIVSSKEARGHLISAGLLSNTIPEEIPEDEIDEMLIGGESPARENMLTATQPPSVGGEGEIRQSQADLLIRSAVADSILLNEPPVFSPEIVNSLGNDYRKALERERKNKSFTSIDRWKPVEPEVAKFKSWITQELNLISSGFSEEAGNNQLDIFTNRSHNDEEQVINAVFIYLAQRIKEYIDTEN